jgi:hypothetical protein
MSAWAACAPTFTRVSTTDVLAACRPERFTIADSRALATLRGLGRMPPGPPAFRLGDWLPYLSACRTLAGQCGLSLRQLDRALGSARPARRCPGDGRRPA